MSSTPVAFSEELLRGACLSHGLSGDGTAAQLHSRLGDFFVRKLLAPETCAPPPNVTEKKKGKKRAAAAAAGAPEPKRTASAYHTFLRDEKERVKQAGFHGRVEIIKEVARRWKLAKQVNTPAAPLMITHSSDAGSSDEAASEGPASETDSTPDALIDALKEELSEQEVNAALAAHGLPIDGDAETRLKMLALAMA